MDITKAPIEEQYKAAVAEFRAAMQLAAETLARKTELISDRAEELLKGEEARADDLERQVGSLQRNEAMRAEEVAGSRRREQTLQERNDVLARENAEAWASLNLLGDFFEGIKGGRQAMERLRQGGSAFTPAQTPAGSSPKGGEMQASIREALGENAAAVEALDEAADPVHPASMEQVSRSMRILLGGKETSAEEQARTIGRSTIDVDALERRLKEPAVKVA